MRRGVRRLLLALAALAIADQAVHGGLLRSGYLAGRRVAPFDPPLFAPFQSDRIDAYRRLAAAAGAHSAQSDFDADLGWCPAPGSLHEQSSFDARGARMGRTPVPDARRPGVRRAVAVGCSFTFGAEVENSEAWPGLVDEARDDLEVLNLGYGAYGLDQALLRWRRDGAREAHDEVWLGLLPSALPRIVTAWMPAMRHWTNVVHFKPRFEFGADGALVLVPAPARSLQDLVDLCADQERFFAFASVHDHWVRRRPSAYAPRGTRLAHHSGFARLALTALERGDRAALPLVLDPASETHRLARAIVRRFASDCATSGVRLRVLILPDRLDLRDRADRGSGYWQALVDGLRADGVEVADLAPLFAERRAADEDRFWMPGGHYSAEGNRIAARAVLAHLRAFP